jgi:hypothetical protein
VLLQSGLIVGMRYDKQDVRLEALIGPEKKLGLLRERAKGKNSREKEKNDDSCEAIHGMAL